MSTQTFEIEERTLARLRTIASAENCTVFIVSLAALNIVIWRYARQSDISIGTTVSNRALEHSRTCLGTSSIVEILRTRVTPGATFRQLIKRVKNVVIEASDHQELPFGTLARALEGDNPKRKTASLFEIMYIYHNLIVHPARTDGLEFAVPDSKYRRVALDVVLTTLKLIFDIREASTKLTGTVIYKPDFVNDGVASGMIRMFQHVLSESLLAPNRRLTTLAWISLKWN